MNTILITGSSSGFGLETARLFLDRGWKVIATMRRPDPKLLPASDNLRILPLDVTDPDSIAGLVRDAGEIDALVNNAGIGWMDALEGIPDATVQKIFATNTFGTMATMRAFLPQFRARGAGVVVNVTSTVTLVPLPFLSVYTASKSAVNAFTESVALELQPFGVRVRLVLPGRAPSTRFVDNFRAAVASDSPFHPDYQTQIQAVMSGWSDDAPVTRSGDVAEAVWRAVTDPDAPMRLPAGADAVALAGSGVVQA